MNLRDVKYKMRYKNSKIIFVSPTKLLDRLEMDSPSYAIRSGKNQIGDRVKRAKEYILKNWDNPEAKKRQRHYIFEPSIVGIYNGCLSFSDGRHRVLAAEELGIPEVAIEIPRSQEKYFEYMKIKPMNESPDYISYPKQGISGHHWTDGQSLPFECLREKGKLRVCVGDWGNSHGTIIHYDYDYNLDDLDEKLILFSGRLWIGEKVISFWKYPNRKDFVDIINQLELILLKKIKRKSEWISNKMWNNKWFVESKSQKKLIPIEDYKKYEEDYSSERPLHLMSWAEKDSLKKSGNDPLKYYKSLGKEKPLAYKQAISQENIITKFKDFQKLI